MGIPTAKQAPGAERALSCAFRGKGRAGMVRLLQISSPKSSLLLNALQKTVTAVISPLDNRRKEKLLGEVRQSQCAGEETPGSSAISWNRVRLKLLAGAACPSKSDARIFGVELSKGNVRSCRVLQVCVSTETGSVLRKTCYSGL